VSGTDLGIIITVVVGYVTGIIATLRYLADRIDRIEVRADERADRVDERLRAIEVTLGRIDERLSHVEH
jgi:hypothetical protein